MWCLLKQVDIWSINEWMCLYVKNVLCRNSHWQTIMISAVAGATKYIAVLLEIRSGACSMLRSRQPSNIPLSCKMHLPVKLSASLLSRSWLIIEVLYYYIRYKSLTKLYISLDTGVVSMSLHVIDDLLLLGACSLFVDGASC